MVENKLEEIDAMTNDFGICFLKEWESLPLDKV